MKFDKKIKEEIDNQIPDLKQNIKNSINWEQVKANNQQSKPKFSLKLATISAVCCVLVAIAIILPIYFNSQNGNIFTNFVYTETISVNPCIRLEVNNQDKVTKQYGLNEDGAIFLHKTELVGMNINEANKFVMDKLLKNGFLQSNVSISINNQDGTKNVTKEQSVSNVLESYLTSLGNFGLLVIDEQKLESIEEYYENNQIGEYEKELINKFKIKLVEITNIKLSEMKNLIGFLEENQNDSEIIQDSTKLLSKIMDFVNKYNFDFDFDLEEFNYEDMIDFKEELEDDYYELKEILEEIQNGADEDDYSEILDDLFDLAEDALYDD